MTTDATLTSPPLATRSVTRAVPRRLGRFELGRELGRGTSGIVFEAHDPSASYPIALKVLRSFDAKHVESFKEEARRLSLLRHPNLVAPFELFADGGYWAFSMELVAGRDLVSYVRSETEPALRARRIDACFRQLADAVASMHEENLLHLDLKPANVLVRDDGHVFVLDFGISRHTGECVAPAGTPGYWSPEQSLGAPLGPESDWYALGVLLHEAWTGQLPQSDGPTPLLHAELPDAARRLCQGLLSHDGAERLAAARRLTELVSSAPIARPRTFIGRGSELELLLAAAQQARAGTSSCVELVGPAGVGKSALVDEFVERLRRADADVLVASSRCYERELTAYKGLDALIRLIIEESRALPEDERTRWARDGLREAALLFPGLQELVPPSAHVEVSTDDGIEVRERAFAAIAKRVASLASERLLVLCIDDLHWADADALALLEAVLRANGRQRLAFVATVRQPSDPASPPPWSEPFEFYRRLTVHNLDEAEATELAFRFTGDPVRALELAAAADGHPFLIAELARQPDVPTTGFDLLEHLVRTRRNALSREAGLLVEVVALFGRPLPEALAWRVVRPGLRHVVLTELRRQGLLRAAVEGGVSVLEPWHQRVLEVVAEELPTNERRRLHGIIADALGAQEGSAGERGHHLHSAGRKDEAFVCFVEAADEAASALAFERAAELLRLALSLDVALGRARGELLERRATCLFQAGRSREAGLEFIEAARELEGDCAREATARAAESLLLAGDIDRGFDVVRDLYRTVTGGTLSSLRAGLGVLWNLAALLWRPVAIARHERSYRISFIADLYWRLAKGLVYVLPLQGTFFLLRTLRIASSAGDPLRSARALGLLGAGMFMQFPLLTRRGESYLALADRIASEREDPYLLAMNDVWRGFAQVYPGNWQAMLAHGEAGLARLRTNGAGLAWEIAVAEGVIVWAYQFLGRLCDCARHAEEALLAARRRGDLYSEILFSQYLAYTEIAAGKLERARARARLVEQRWTRRSYTVQHFYAMVIEAMADLATGAAESAAQRFLHHRDDFRKAGGQRTQLGRIDYTLLEARIVVNLGPERARQLGLRSVPALREALRRETRADCAGHAAWLGAAGQRDDEAREGWDEAARRYAEAGMQLHAACARLQRGSEPVRAHDELRGLGVGDPETWLRVLMPRSAAPPPG